MSELNLYQKIIEVRKEISFFSKDAKGFNYSYVSGSQVLAKIKNKMDSLGLLLEPSVDYTQAKYEIFQYDTTDKYGKSKHNIDYIVSGPMSYTWINCDKPEEREAISWSYFGQQDEISKAFGSALTYSERYFLMKYFNVPTDDLDPDLKQQLTNDKGQDDKKQQTIDRAKAAAAKAREAAEKSKQEKKANEPISSMQANNLLRLSNNDVDICRNVIKAYGYAKSGDILNKDYEMIYNDIKKAAMAKEPKIVITG